MACSSRANFWSASSLSAASLVARLCFNACCVDVRSAISDCRAAVRSATPRSKVALSASLRSTMKAIQVMKPISNAPHPMASRLASTQVKRASVSRVFDVDQPIRQSTSKAAGSALPQQLCARVPAGKKSAQGPSGARTHEPAGQHKKSHNGGQGHGNAGGFGLGNQGEKAKKNNDRDRKSAV